MDFQNLNQSLPFSDFIFYGFILGSVGAIYLARIFVKGNNPKIYTASLFILSLGYCSFLYPHPERILPFFAFGYLIYRFGSFKRKWNKALTVSLYILPMVLMKLFNVLPEFKSDIRIIVQIAGISYATFKMLQIHFDEQQVSGDRKQIRFIEYFTFLAFPATLLIGPIDRFNRFQSDLKNGFSQLTLENFLKGLDFFIKGILFKYILATLVYDLILKQIDISNGVGSHFGYMYTYLIYLFFDFAGYSLLAMGFGYLLGIQVPFNFNKPFLAENPKEFWHRWHKTLGDWLNDYFFKPIFKSLTTRKVFKPIQRQSIALLLTFTLMGCWNGFELHYIVSGMLFGFYSVIHNYYSYQSKKNGRDVFFGNLNPKIVRVLSIFIMFNSVAFSIYIFSGKLF